jgi:hypothetical protein
MKKEEYYDILSNCDVGIVTLNHHFTIPNYPSRVLPYMQASLPLIVASDSITDLSLDAENNYFGKYCSSNNPIGFIKLIEYYKNPEIRKIHGLNSYNFFINNFN